MGTRMAQTRPTAHLSGTFTFRNWEEKPFSEAEGGAKLGHALVVNDFHGGIEGTGTCGYLLVYRSESEGVFHGYEQVVGSVEGRSGSFVLEHSGTFEGDTVHCRLSIVPGAGTGGLAGLRGTGGFTAEHGKATTPFTLDAEFTEEFTEESTGETSSRA